MSVVFNKHFKTELLKASQLRLFETEYGLTVHFVYIVNIMEMENCVVNSNEKSETMLPPASPAKKAEKRSASEELKPVLLREEDGKTIRIPITKSGV